MLLAILLSACTQETEHRFSKPERIPSVQLAEPDTTTVPFGEPVDLTLRFNTKDPMGSLNPEAWLEPGVTLLDDEIEVLESETGWQQDVSLTVAIYAVTSTPVFVSTPLVETPDLTLPFLSLETTTRITDSDNVPSFGTGDPPDFRGPEALKRRKRNLWIGSGALVVLLIVLGLLTRYFATRERPVPPPTPAHVIALRRLEELTQAPIWVHKDVEAATVELSLILREYIERRFGIQAPDLTTEEFLLQVEAEAPWPADKQAGLNTFFGAADRIKYAGDRPASEILDELYASVSEFVTTTQGASE